MDQTIYDYPDGDIKFLVEGRIFCVHKRILSSASDVFKDMFDHATSEKDEAVSTVPLSQESAQSFEWLLSIIYHGSSFIVDSNNVSEIIRISDKFMVERAIEKSLFFLDDNFRTDPLNSLLVAEKYKRKPLFKVSSKLVLDDYYAYKKDPNYSRLSPQTCQALENRYNQYENTAMYFDEKSLTSGYKHTCRYADWHNKKLEFIIRNIIKLINDNENGKIYNIRVHRSNIKRNCPRIFWNYHVEKVIRARFGKLENLTDRDWRRKYLYMFIELNE
ncbi:3802_t:CDS:1 [Acaulospora morrowiae]|uniref:3802_t:CDS:1 n=1 Tax=Acaulospora morrowiae TaxID=94023 RepID=A0A9N8YYW5_9GLOM|nr:3802_t:CDS:1 [Acaulospora morrowiae]